MPDPMAQSPIVQTLTGKVQGLIEPNGAQVFRGIPYAASTAGEGRFRPPSAQPNWTGVRSATTFANVAPQPSASTIRISPAVAEIFGLMDSEPPSAEDCLALNVWTPAAGPEGRRPVMVWLHGGGFTTGFGGAEGRPATYGDKLAAENDVVVVTLNHRLGALGFLYLADVDEARFGASGNLGMLDIVAALEWIRDNIAAFGGDPGNVTLFGESAGAIKASVLMAMPAAQGLFHKAIMQSGAGTAGAYRFGLEMFSRQTALDYTSKFMAELGLQPGQTDCLLELPTQTLMRAQASMIAKSGIIGGPVGFAPVVDGHYLPVSPFHPDLAPGARDVPIIIGTTTHEITTMLANNPMFGRYEQADLLPQLSPVVGPRAPHILQTYRCEYPDLSPTRLLSLILSDLWRLMAAQIADLKVEQGAAPVYMYEFGYETEVMDGLLGANHGLDISFAFNTAERIAVTGQRPERLDVAAVMSRAWAHFARSGHPGAMMYAEWPVYKPNNHASMMINTQCSVRDFMPSTIRAAWS